MAARTWSGYSAHVAAGRRSTQQAPCVPHRPWLSVQYQQQQQKQKQRQPVGFRHRQAPAGRQYRVARLTCAAASSLTTGSLEPEGPSGEVISLLRPLSNAKANAKLLALCGAQMLASVATLLHDTYLPLYLSEVLHMSNTRMGNLHALLQFLAKATGIISGRLSDFLPPSRMVVLGTLLTALCKPAFGLAGIVHSALGTGACVSWIASAKIVDRACKGIREAPSKVFIAQLAAQSGDSAGAAFSLRYAFSTLGMLGGASAASLAFHLSHRNFVLTFTMSALPAALALLLVATALGGDISGGTVAPGGGLAGDGLPDLEVPAGSDDEAAVPSGALGKLAAFLGALTPPFWQALLTVFLLYIARFDTSFLILHARTVMEEASLPMLTPFAMVPVVLLAPSMGLRAKASVHARNTVIQLGIGMLVLSNLAFMLLPSPAGCFLGSIFVGVHMAMTQGVTTGMLAAYIPSCSVPGLGRVCGAVWAFVDLLLGIALACSNVLAGRLSDLTARRGMGNTGCFLGGLVACLLSMLALACFSSLGELGREDRVPAIQPVATGSFG